MIIRFFFFCCPKTGSNTLIEYKVKVQLSIGFRAIYKCVLLGFVFFLLSENTFTIGKKTFRKRKKPNNISKADFSIYFSTCGGFTLELFFLFYFFIFVVLPVQCTNLS